MSERATQRQTQEKPDKETKEMQPTKKKFLTQADVDAVNKRWEGIPQNQPLTLELARRVMRDD